jgi:predicted heme/steroid binding protein
MLTLTPEQLARFDGSDRWLPVYVGILGEVYDVSKNRRIYGQGGSYNMMWASTSPLLY